jgi:puromycin-sensitive aminopeptidase
MLSMSMDHTTDNAQANATLDKVISYRLPTVAVPTAYKIDLIPDLQTFTFSGNETIALTVESETKEIILNALDLSIESATIEQNGNTQTADVSLEVESERARFVFPAAIKAGTATLTIKFTGEINDKLRGFYRSAQNLKDGEKSWIALTQFEATDARRAFPCFDEPSFKATFQLTLTVDKHLTALSNTQVESEKIDEKNGKKTITFKQTMKMSTYIVAFVIGELEVSETVMVDGIPMQIYAPLGKVHMTKFALEIGAAALTFFNKYYGIKYPGDKMDMIAVPDFAFGAMENLGAVIYRESALLVDQSQASHAELERVADVVAHELAHMWFGNLTTMKWWNGIWLNEAFATFMELVAVDNFAPQWKRWETFGVSRAMAFATDGLKATRPIEFPVTAPSEANGMFDVLTYEKGASVLRMLEQYIGPEKFKQGVNAYLNKHKFANTETNDLWDALAAASDVPVQQIMNSWIFQEGYPLISVDTFDGAKSIILKQKRFYYLADTSGEELYHVPILLKAKLADSDTMVEKRILLNESEFMISFEQKVEWILINAGGSGFYRVNYSHSLMEELKSNLQALSTLERFNLASDQWALAINGTIKLDEFFEFARLFKDESDKNVWTVLIAALQYSERVLNKNAAAGEKIVELTQEILQPTYKKLGWETREGEDELTKQLRGMAIGTLGTTGQDNAIQKEAQARYSKHVKGEAVLAPDVLSAVVTILASCGDEKRYAEFEQAFKAGSSPQEQERYMYALAQFKQENLLQKTLEKTLNGEVKGQNAPYLVRNLMLNPAGRHVGWKFMSSNWETINKTFPSLIMTRLVEGVTGLTEEKLAKEVFAFFDKYEFAGGQKTVDQHLEKLRVALAFLKANG